MAILSRVVAVHAIFSDGSRAAKFGSGYLIDGRTLLTALHVLENGSSLDLSIKSVRVTRAVDNFQIVIDAVQPGAVVPDRNADWAVLHLPVPFPDSSGIDRIAFDFPGREKARLLEGCVVIGYPSFAHDEASSPLHREIYGSISATDNVENGHFLMHGLHEPGPKQRPVDTTAWDGLSGGVVFFRERAIGIVVAHRSADGNTALDVSSADLVRQGGSQEIRELLNLNSSAHSTLNSVPLVRQLEIQKSGEVPRLRDLSAYDLGATDWREGSESDKYVARTRESLDARLFDCIQPGSFVIVRGNSKSGKTRTAYEALLSKYPDAFVIAPTEQSLVEVVRHHEMLRLGGEKVLWLDDAERYFTREHGLTPSLLGEVRSLPGMMIVGTIRTDQHSAISRSDVRDARIALGQAKQMVVGYMNHDREEHAACLAAYPGRDLGNYSLSEHLVGAPDFKRIYDDSRWSDIALRVVIETAIDWSRTGIGQPVPHERLAALALTAARDRYPSSLAGESDIADAIDRARTPIERLDGTLPYGRISALEVVEARDDSWSYSPLDYLVSTDFEFREISRTDDDPDGSDNSESGLKEFHRTISEGLWLFAIEHADPDAALRIASRARALGSRNVEESALRKAALAGSAPAMRALYKLLDGQLPSTIGQRS